MTLGDGKVVPRGVESPLIRCEGIAVRLPTSGGHREILSGVSLDLRAGEIVCIVGGSGTGKTTLLRALAGLIPVSAGTIHYDGQPVNHPPDGIVTVFQDYGNALLEWRTVAGNVALGLEGRVGKSERDRRVADALKVVGLDRVRDEYPWRLSGGMQQRVQIARALAVRPRVLLMDEPFGALDAMTKASLQDQLLTVSEWTGATVVFITHDVDEAVYLADRILVMTGPPGRITDSLDVQLPRPRDQIETKERQDFLASRRHVHDLLAANHE